MGRRKLYFPYTGDSSAVNGLKKKKFKNYKIKISNGIPRIRLIAIRNVPAYDLAGGKKKNRLIFSTTVKTRGDRSPRRPSRHPPIRQTLTSALCFPNCGEMVMLYTLYYILHIIILQLSFVTRSVSRQEEYKYTRIGVCVNIYTCIKRPSSSSSSYIVRKRSRGACRECDDFHTGWHTRARSRHVNYTADSIHTHTVNALHSCGQIPQGDTSNLHGNTLFTAAV